MGGTRSHGGYEISRFRPLHRVEIGSVICTPVACYERVQVDENSNHPYQHMQRPPPELRFGTPLARFRQELIDLHENDSA